jgi:murein DD-endopeptidase MepM/ murein hydrolase activator NlpD
MADKDKPKATTRLPRINRRGATAENIADMPESVRDSIRRQLQEQKVTVAAPIKRVLGLVRDNTDDRRKMRVEQAARSEEIQTQTTATNSRLSTVVEEQKKTTGLLRELLNTIRQNRGLGGRGSGGGRNDPRRTPSLPSRIWNFTRNVALPAVGLGAMYFAGQERMQREGLVPTPNRPLNLLTNNALGDFDPIGMNDREDTNTESDQKNNQQSQPQRVPESVIDQSMYSDRAFAASMTPVTPVTPVNNDNNNNIIDRTNNIINRSLHEQNNIVRQPGETPADFNQRVRQSQQRAVERLQNDGASPPVRENTRPQVVPSPPPAAPQSSPTTNQQPQTPRPSGILRRLFLDPIRPSSDSGGFDPSAVRNAAFRIDESRDEAAPRAMAPDIRNIVFKAQEIKFKADEFEFVRPEAPSDGSGSGGGMTNPSSPSPERTPPPTSGQSNRGSGDEGSSLRGEYGAPRGGTGSFGLPLDSIHITTNGGFGDRNLRGRLNDHKGVDLRAAIGTPVYATHDGIVTRAGRGTNYGLVIYLRGENGFETRYAHLSRINVRVNERVERGRIIGYSGDTDTEGQPHLHYEILENNQPVNPGFHNPELLRDNPGFRNPGLLRNNTQGRIQTDATPVAPPASSQGSGDAGVSDQQPRQPPAVTPVDSGINMKVGEELNAASMNSQAPIPISATMGGETAAPETPYDDSTFIQTRSIDPDNPGNVEPADAMTYYAELFPGLRLAS